MFSAILLSTALTLGGGPVPKIPNNVTAVVQIEDGTPVFSSGTYTLSKINANEWKGSTGTTVTRLYTEGSSVFFESIVNGQRFHLNGALLITGPLMEFRLGHPSGTVRVFVK